MPQNKYNPAYDNKIPQKYSKKTIANKMKNKEAFFKEIDLPFDKRIPVVCITYRLTDENKVNLIQDVMNGLLEQNIVLVVTGIGTESYQKFFTDLASKNQNVVISENTEDERRLVYAASDIILIPTDSAECKDEAVRAMRYGVVPVSPQLDGMEDYQPNLERGNAFIYKKHSPWSLFASFIRAFENFRFPYDWKNIASSAMDNE